MKIHFRGNRVVPCLQTEMTKLIELFLISTKAADMMRKRCRNYKYNWKTFYTLVKYLTAV